MPRKRRFRARLSVACGRARSAHRPAVPVCRCCAPAGSGPRGAASPRCRRPWARSGRDSCRLEDGPARREMLPAVVNGHWSASFRQQGQPYHEDDPEDQENMIFVVETSPTRSTRTRTSCIPAVPASADQSRGTIAINPGSTILLWSAKSGSLSMRGSAVWSRATFTEYAAHRFARPRQDFIGRFQVRSATPGSMN
jgi:hypothetical protein